MQGLVDAIQWGLQYLAQRQDCPYRIAMMGRGQEDGLVVLQGGMDDLQVGEGHMPAQFGRVHGQAPGDFECHFTKVPVAVFQYPGLLCRAQIRKRAADIVLRDFFPETQNIKQQQVEWPGQPVQPGHRQGGERFEQELKHGIFQAEPCRAGPAGVRAAGRTDFSFASMDRM